MMINLRQKTPFQFLKALLILLNLNLFLSSHLFAKNLCTPFTLKELKEYAAKKEELNLVFFASWCPECKIHLEQNLGKNTVLVSVLDSQDRADKVIEYLKLNKYFCIFDKDNSIANGLGVHTLPFTMKL